MTPVSLLGGMAGTGPALRGFAAPLKPRSATTT